MELTSQSDTTPTRTRALSSSFLSACPWLLLANPEHNETRVINLPRLPSKDIDKGGDLEERIKYLVQGRGGGGEIDEGS